MLRLNLILVCVALASASLQSESVRLTLPPTIYAASGVAMNVHFANTVLISPDRKSPISFRCECPVGKIETNRWTLTANAKQIGTYPFRLTALNEAGEVIGNATSKLEVNSRLTTKPLKLFILGDSLTHATYYPNEIARLLSAPGNSKWQMLGTHRPRSAKPGVVHEGYGGWTWNRFRTKFTPERPYPGKTNSSPFVFAGQDGKPELDVARYFREHCAGAKPDFITIMLGINDCFGAKSDTPETIDPRIDLMFRESDLLMSAIRKAVPDAIIGVCLTTPANSRDAAFVAHYKQRYTRWGWRRVQHRLVERQIEHFQDREQENIHLIPIQLNLDCTDGYPVRNAVHPNEVGYAQIGASIYSWLVARVNSSH